MCGFVGLIGTQEAPDRIVLALQTIQHRGQDAAGIGTLSNGRLKLVKGLGLIVHALSPSRLEGLEGAAGIGHVRYPTAGSTNTPTDAQPFLSRRPGILLAHNGNITNVPELTEKLEAQGYTLLSQCDSEAILLVLAKELTQIKPAGYTIDDVTLAISRSIAQIRGAYSVVFLMQIDGQDTLVSFRDPHGIRPGVYGRSSSGDWMTASESVALDVLEFEKVGDLPAGGVVFMRPGQAPILRQAAPAVPRPCVFERIYFARTDSRMEDGRINRTRWLLGRALAVEVAQKKLDIDLVMAVPDTSRPAAMAIADELGLPHREGFIKNRYSARTFIMANQATRKAALRLKLNPIPEMFTGKRILLIDDSIVRGNTMQRIVEMVRKLSPAAIHVAIYSPPVSNPCFYGIDMPTRAELIAARLPHDDIEAQLASFLGADTVTYLSLDSLHEVVGSDVCAACFDGDYVVPVSAQERQAITAQRRSAPS